MLPGLYEDRRYSAHFSFFPPIRGVSVRSSRLKIRQRSEFWFRLFRLKIEGNEFMNLGVYILSQTWISDETIRVPVKRTKWKWEERKFVLFFECIHNNFPYIWIFFFFFPFDTLCLSRIYYLLIRLYLLAKILTVSNIR